MMAYTNDLLFILKLVLSRRIEELNKVFTGHITDKSLLIVSERNCEPKSLKRLPHEDAYILRCHKAFAGSVQSLESSEGFKR